MKLKTYIIFGFLGILLIVNIYTANAGMSLRVKVNSLVLSKDYSHIDSSWPYSTATEVGTGVGVNDLVILNCHNDENCNDDNPSTLDSCVNPGTYESICKNIPDTTPPEAIIKYNQTKKDFEVIGVDDRGGEVKVNCINFYNFFFQIKSCVLDDQHGNTLRAYLKYSRSREDFKLIVLNLIYNGGRIKPSLNEFDITDNKKIINQTISINDITKIKVGAIYNRQINKTDILVSNGTNTERYTREGFAPLELKTNKGNLRYNIDSILRVPEVQAYPI